VKNSKQQSNLEKFKEAGFWWVSTLMPLNDPKAPK